jgi:hypothetical protein
MKRQARFQVERVQPEVARCCVSHAAWSQPGVCLEEKTVALADKLWKGKREHQLELLVIDELASRLRCDRWDVFPDLDAAGRIQIRQPDFAPGVQRLRPRSPQTRTRAPSLIGTRGW